MGTLGRTLVAKTSATHGGARLREPSLSRCREASATWQARIVVGVVSFGDYPKLAEEGTVASCEVVLASGHDSYITHVSLCRCVQNRRGSNRGSGLDRKSGSCPQTRD